MVEQKMHLEQHVSYSRWVVSLDIEKLPDIYGLFLDEVERDRLFRVSPDQSRLYAVGSYTPYGVLCI